MIVLENDPWGRLTVLDTWGNVKAKFDLVERAREMASIFGVGDGDPVFLVVHPVPGNSSTDAVFPATDGAVRGVVDWAIGEALSLAPSLRGKVDWGSSYRELRIVFSIQKLSIPRGEYEVLREKGFLFGWSPDDVRKFEQRLEGDMVVLEVVPRRGRASLALDKVG